MADDAHDTATAGPLCRDSDVGQAGAAGARGAVDGVELLPVAAGVRLEGGADEPVGLRVHVDEGHGVAADVKVGRLVVFGGREAAAGAVVLLVVVGTAGGAVGVEEPEVGGGRGGQGGGREESGEARHVQSGCGEAISSLVMW